MRAEDAPRVGQARDVVAFGQEVGRVLSDGRVVGRAEPFAKVFPSSRTVKRAVGPTAWVILEDIALDARLDDEGRLVADTNVRRIAGNLSLAPNTVARHLGRLRDHGFVLHEEGRPAGDGRFVTARYVLDPSAAVERFTLTPPGADVGDDEAGEPCRSSCDTDGCDPCRSGCDTVPRRTSCDTGENGSTRASSAVSQPARHRDLRHNRDSAAVVQQQQTIDDDRDAASEGPSAGELLGRLTQLEVDPSTAEALLAEHPATQVRDALDAVAGTDARKPAGWVVAAVRSGWDVSELAAQQRKLVDRRGRGDREAAERAADGEAAAVHRRREAGWLAVVLDAVDDRQLATVVAAVTEPVAPFGRRALPAVRARLASVAAAAHTDAPQEPLAAALLATAASPDRLAACDRLPEPPPVPGGTTSDVSRLRTAIAVADAAAAGDDVAPRAAAAATGEPSDQT